LLFFFCFRNVHGSVVEGAGMILITKPLVRSQAKNWKTADSLNAPFCNQIREREAKLTFSSRTVLLVSDLDIVFTINEALEGGCAVREPLSNSG
jgi:hypothetical protein